MVESGSKGGVVAVLLKVRKSLTWVRRDWAGDGLGDDEDMVFLGRGLGMGMGILVSDWGLGLGRWCVDGWMVLIWFVAIIAAVVANNEN